LLSLQNGSAQGGLTLKYLKNYCIDYPKDRNEQNRISNSLFCLDKTIQHNKMIAIQYKQQRKALQQYLLNGIVRVLND